MNEMRLHQRSSVLLCLLGLHALSLLLNSCGHGNPVVACGSCEAQGINIDMSMLLVLLPSVPSPASITSMARWPPLVTRHDQDCCYCNPVCKSRTSSCRFARHQRALAGVCSLGTPRTSWALTAHAIAVSEVQYLTWASQPREAMSTQRRPRPAPGTSTRAGVWRGGEAPDGNKRFFSSAKTLP